MRLIEILPSGDLRLIRKVPGKPTPQYAILSHTWGDEGEEVTYEDMVEGIGRDKAGFKKLMFCGEQAERDNLQYFWVDSCCIKKSSDAELSESLNSMFRWYQHAAKCYVYLSDVTAADGSWEQMFRKSRWFTRGWTLQELLAPTSLEFFAQGDRLGDRESLLRQIHEITGIPTPALRGATLTQYTPDEVFAWARNRQTLREEDWVYSLLGIFGISMPIIYGEGRTHAIRRLEREMADPSRFPQILRTADHQNHSSNSKLVESMSAFVQETRNVFLSESTTLQRHLAQVYADLAQQRTLLHRLSNIVEGVRRGEDERSFICSNCDEVHAKLYGRQCANIKQSDLTSADIFFDCISRFNVQRDLAASIDGLSAGFTGNPAYTHERNASFHPEMYAMGGLFADPFFVLAIKRSSADNQLVQHYYLLYARTPRSWYWIIVSVIFMDAQAASAVPQASIRSVQDAACIVLPDAITRILQIELPLLRLYPSVTRISLSLNQRSASQSTHPHRCVSTEDIRESKMAQEQALLDEIEAAGCQIFRESQIQVLYRKSSSGFAVSVDGQICIERKRSFAFAGWDDEPSLGQFMDGLKTSYSLRHCNGVARFIGAVLDDHGLRLRSYLYEAPMLNAIHSMFYVANSRSEIIPWSIRELWAKQIAQAITDIHSKGFTIGDLGRDNIGLKADGSAILHSFAIPDQPIFLDDEDRPPELSSPEGDESQQHFDNRTDMYQFARCLWALAEHRGNTRGLRCSRNACSNFPRYQCKADHANPALLPPLLNSVPLYFQKLITQCRSLDPNERPTAWRSSDILSAQCQITVCQPDVLVFLKRFMDGKSFGAHCSECGERANNPGYHCYVCDSGDFDLCVRCVAQGIHCLVVEHVLVKRRATTDGFDHIS